jgi:biopolymer transport protein ExbD
MAGGARDDNGGIIAGINVTPLVDVSLVLLIIFIVTAKIVVAPTVPMELPQASQTEETQVIFSVIVPTTGLAIVNGTPVGDDDNLLQLAKDAAQTDRDVRAVINADAAVPHGRVIRILDLLKQGGVCHIAFGATSTGDRPR